MELLTAERLRQVVQFNPETGEWIRLGAKTNQLDPGPFVPSIDAGYGRIKIDGRKYLAHRLAWLYVHGSWPIQFIDHINGNKTDNRIANLRDVSKNINQQNARKARRTNRCGLLGVSAANRYGRHQARITVYGERRSIGYYGTPEAAHAAYLSAKRKMHEGCTI